MDPNLVVSSFGRFLIKQQLCEKTTWESFKNHVNQQSKKKSPADCKPLVAEIRHLIQELTDIVKRDSYETVTDNSDDTPMDSPQPSTSEQTEDVVIKSEPLDDDQPDDRVPPVDPNLVQITASKAEVSKGNKSCLFAVVEFAESDSMAVVYTAWLIQDPKGADLCYWPGGDAINMTLQRVEPNRKWELYYVKILGKFCTFERAYSFANEYDDESQSPEMSDEVGKKRKRRKNPRLLTTYDPPEVVDAENEIAQDEEDGQQEGITVHNKRHKLSKKLELTANGCQAMDQERSDDIDAMQVEELLFGPMYTGQPGIQLQSFSGASVDAKLDILLQNQQTMMSMLHRLVSSGSGGGATVDVKEHMEEQFKEKCTTYEALMEFDQKVQNDQQYRLQLISYLSSFEGNSVRDLARKMLLALTTKEVLKVFSLRGQKRRKFEAGTVIYQTKKGIHTTAIYNCIKRACRRKNSSYTELTVDKAVAEYLKANAKNSTLFNTPEKAVYDAAVSVQTFTDEGYGQDNLMALI